VAADHYAVLGVAHDATQDEIKRAYRRLARELHPDVNPDTEASERFKDVTAAYEILSDAQRRQMYDLGFSGNGGGGGFGGFGGFGGGGLGDFVEAFFGQGAPRGPRSRQQRGHDALIPLTIDLLDAARGLSRDITLDTAVACERCKGEGTAEGSHPETCPMCKGRGEVQSVQRSLLGQIVTSRACPQCNGFGSIIANPCGDCSGEGRVRTRQTLTVQIPGGVDTGTRLHLPGRGEVGPGGGPNGDLYVEINVRPHPTLTRRGDDLITRIVVPMTSATLGTSIDVTTLDGPEPIGVKAGTQSGETLTLRGRGMPRLRGSGAGDLHVILDVATPTRLDDEQRELLEKFADLRGEERAEVVIDNANSGLFSRIKDAFNGK
jgi:molecular chaperone DnaJ